MGEWDEDRRKMERHLKYSSLDHAMHPEDDHRRRKFNPVEIPLRDILAVETEKDYGWMFPSRDTMMKLQVNRVLARSMVRTCRVEEIILNGEQTEEEQRRIVAWHHKQLALDQAEMPGAPLSLDVEEVHCTLMDVLHLSGQRPH